MSTQQALTIVGTAVGAYFGYPELGALAGSLVGSYFQPDIHGPKLGDAKIQMASYGSPLAIPYGGVQVAGTVVWELPELIATESSQSSKGSPDVVTTSYSATFCVAICEGPIGGIRRIWAGSLLIYDIRDGLDVAAQAQSASIAEHMTVYLGAEDQMPDPTIESFVGVGKVEPMRGTALAVFNMLPVGRYGNTIPSLRFEVTSAAVEPIAAESVEPLQIFPWLFAGDGVRNGTQGITEYDVYTFGDDGFTLEKILTTNDYGAAKVALFGATSPSCTEFVGYYTRSQFQLSRFSFATDLSPLDPDDPSPTEVDLCWAPFQPDRVISDTPSHLMVEDVRNFQGHGLVPNDPKNILVSSIQFQSPAGYGGNALFGFLTLVPYPVHPAGYRASLGADFDFGADGGGYFPEYWAAPFAIIRARRIPTAPAQRCLPGRPEDMGGIAELPGNANVCVTSDGQITPNVAYSVEVGEFKALRAAGPSDPSHSRPAVGPVLRPGDVNYNSQAFWEAQAAAAGITGTYGGDYPETLGAAAVGASPFAEAGTAPIGLGTVVADLCRRGGETRVDVSELTDMVRGYLVARPMPARQAIDSLRAAYDFDAVESGEQIVFRKRGRSPVATLTLDDIGAAIDAPGEPTQPTRKQEAELPREVRVAYLSSDADFQLGAQQSRRRVVGSDQVLSVELPIVLSDLEAARICDRILYQLWAGRTERKFSTTVAHSHLEPTDVVLVNDGERTVRVRIVETSDARGVAERTAVDDDPEALATNSSAGSTASSTTPGIELARPTKLEALDIPLARDADDATAAGFYLAASGYGDAKWPGTRVFRSTDSGASFASLLDVSTAATIGTATQLGPFAGGNVVDESNSVDVRLNSGTLSSITRAQLLNGGGLCVIGNEELQFQRAEFLGGKSWRLSGFLRGRKGTEREIGAHGQGERFVLLDGALVRTSGGGASQIGIPTVIKGVTLGSSLADAYPQPFTNGGAGARPLAPVQLYALSDGAGGYAARWTRRTRISGAGIRLGVAAPLGEAAEAYDVELRDAGGALVSTERVTAPAWVHSVPAAVVTATMPPRVRSVIAKSGSTYFVQQVDGVAARTIGASAPSSETPPTVSQVAGVLEIGGDLFVIGHSVPIGQVLPVSRGVYRVAKSALGTITASDVTTGSGYFLDAVTDGTSIFVATSEGTVLRYSTALALLETISLTAPNYINALAIDGAGALYVAQGYLGVAQIIKYDPATSAVVWTVTAPEMHAYAGTLAVIGGAVIMATNAAFLRFDTADGATLSPLALPDDFSPSSIFAIGGRLLAGLQTVVNVPGASYTYQHVGEFDPASGALLWRSEALGVSSALVALPGGELWFGNARVESTGSNDLSGHSLTVYQVSDTAGRGYPARATIT